MAIVALAVIVVFVAWRVEVRLHPIRRCPACNGSKKNPGSNSQRWGTCSRCSGKGEVRRWGAPK